MPSVGKSPHTACDLGLSQGHAHAYLSTTVLVDTFGLVAASRHACAQDLLAAEGTGYLVGGNLTYVDLALFQKLYELGQEDNLGSGMVVEGC